MGAEITLESSCIIFRLLLLHGCNGGLFGHSQCQSVPNINIASNSAYYGPCSEVSLFEALFGITQFFFIDWAPFGPHRTTLTLLMNLSSFLGFLAMRESHGTVHDTWAPPWAPPLLYLSIHDRRAVHPSIHDSE